jgi:DNA-directed RNA polymerase specialized sigma24 family protein
VQAYEQLATLRDRSRFGSWLLTIVHRRALNAVRANKRRQASALTASLPDAAAHERIARALGCSVAMQRDS